MANSKIPLKLTGFLILLLITPLFVVQTVSSNTQEAKAVMISGVLAHEMNASQAQFLVEHGIWVEADVEINKTEGNWANIYNLTRQYNLSLIGKLCHVTMDWNTSFTLQDWNQTVQEATMAYGDAVKVWEIWNEPTSSNFYCGYYDGNTSKYTEMLKAAYQIIKTQSPNSTVIGLGGLHMYSGNETFVENSTQFAREVAAMDGMNYCDAVSLHAYPWGNSDNTAVATAFNNSLNAYRNITGNKEVWITEVGQHSNTWNFTPADQDNFLKQTFNFFSSQNSTAYIWYELNDNGRIENDQLTTFGLYDNCSNPKPARDTLIALTANLTSPIPSPTPTPTETPLPTPSSTPKTATIPKQTKTPTPTPKPTATPTPSPTLTPTPTLTRQSTTPTPIPVDISFRPVFFAAAGFSVVFLVLGGLFLFRKHKS
jgi:hypothetical protein